MPKKEDKGSAAYARKEKQRETESQNAELFRIGFLDSSECLKFRKAWDIPEGGFDAQSDYDLWNKKFFQAISDYYASDKNKARLKKLGKKKMELGKGKITESDFAFYAQELAFANPNYKYGYDVMRVVLASEKPTYWKEYIEQCLVFKNPKYPAPWKPLPEPKLRWNEEFQFYDLVIENIFPDTGTKDFDDPRFTEKLDELKKKIPGNSSYRPRYKKNFSYGMDVLKLDAEAPYLVDTEKAQELSDKLKGKEKTPLVGITGKREKGRMRQNRGRYKKYLRKKA